jgi:AraC-like DNA-binding protein
LPAKRLRAATGRTFMSMVKLLRINEACRLLSNGSNRITDVAFSSGWPIHHTRSKTVREY